jgi:adenine-specific DNA-methyltransferase
MANLSKAKREKILQQLKVIKENLQDIQLKANITEIESFVTENKYGLIFEKHSENVFEELSTKIPLLKADNSREILTSNSPETNFILEGDNLQSLYLLNKTHKNSIDVIYIDPPYNNGSRDWKYNNDFVDKNDGYRHSKWLSMMNERLNLSKKLLKKDGVLICAIDENELATLTLLLEEIFGLDYRIDTICIVHNPRGVQGDNFSYTNEYALFVYKKGLKVIESREIEGDEIDWRDLRDNGHESLRTDAATCFYSIDINTNGEIIGFGPNKTKDAEFHPSKNIFNSDGSISIFPIDKNGIERKWRYNRESVLKIRHLLKVKKIKDVFDIELGKDFGTYKTVWTDKKYDSNENGTKVINDMVPNNDFDFPKSIYNVYDCLYSVIKSKPNAIVLDFFAGSGTTGHAVLLMNNLIGGNRKFILCTNNDVGDEKEKEFIKVNPNLVKEGRIDKLSKEYKEFEEKYGIARSITFPRIKSAIIGYVSNSGSKTIIFEEKITASSLFNRQKHEQLLTKIDEVITSKKSDFNTLKTVLEENTIRIYGINEKQEKVKGLGGNLTYLKTSFVNKYSNNEDLASLLTFNINDLITLKNMQKIDESLILLSDDNLENIISNIKKYKGRKIYLSPFVLLDYESKDLLLKNEIQIIKIPESFFEKELYEVGEL